MKKLIKRSTDDKKLLAELAIVLIVKIVILIVIWHHFFDTPITLETPDDVADALLGHVEQGAPH